AFDLEGPDSHALFQPPAPALASGQAAAELAELYWMALARDVHFADYGASLIIAAAAADLSRFSDFRAPRLGRRVTHETIFRSTRPTARLALSSWVCSPFRANATGTMVAARHATPAIRTSL